MSGVLGVLSQVSGYLGDQVDRAGARVLSVEVCQWCYDLPVRGVQVHVHVATDREVSAKTLSGLLGLDLVGDEVRQDVAGEASSSRRWLTWSGWHAEESLPCPVLWEVVTSYALDQDACPGGQESRPSSAPASVPGPPWLCFDPGSCPDCVGVPCGQHTTRSPGHEDCVGSCLCGNPLTVHCYSDVRPDLCYWCAESLDTDRDAEAVGL